MRRETASVARDEYSAQEAALELLTVQFTADAPSAVGGFDGAALLEAASHCAGDPSPLLEVLRSASDAPPVPGSGNTTALWEMLASVAALDLTAARALEPHLDAAAILDQAGVAWETGTSWGVFAAEGPGMSLEAVDNDDGWILQGEKPWCSLAGSLDRAIITAAVPGGRRAFAVDLRQSTVVSAPSTWVSHGLANIPSGPLQLEGVHGQPVGGTDWYLHRDGFAWGGLSVASCWFGGAVGLFRSLHRAATIREPDQLALAWLGEADRLLASGAALLAAAASSVDAGHVGWRTAHRVRGHIVALCEGMLSICGRALGPGPLAFDADHARRVADLTVYIRQHHAARDDAALGRLLIEGTADSPDARSCPW